jgi:hypothetical protein
VDSSLKMTILILAANPRGTNPLRLDEEVRQIEQALLRSPYRDRFKVISQWAVRPDDIRQALLTLHPQIVHFCGHGAGEKGLVLVKDIAVSSPTNDCLVSGEALANLFKRFKQQLYCVVLNACYSEVQAIAINHYIDYVIGMKHEIGDPSAIKFSVGFYDALGGGESIESAYELGCNAIQLDGLVGHLIPTLEKKRLSITDCQLVQLINDVCRYSDVLGSERREAFARLLPYFQELPIHYKRPGQKYLQALDQTWKWVALNLCAFQVEPHKPIHLSLEKWINKRLYQEMQILKQQPEPDLQAPFLSDLDNFEIF